MSRHREDDANDDRPRRRKRRSAERRKVAGTAVALVVVGGALLLVGVLAAAFFVLRPNKKADEVAGPAEKYGPAKGGTETNPGGTFRPATKTEEKQKYDVVSVSIPNLKIAAGRFGFAGGPNGCTAFVNHFGEKAGLGRPVLVLKNATGKALGSFSDGFSDATVFALTPDGAYHSAILPQGHDGRGEGATLVIHRVSDGMRVDDRPQSVFRPYPRKDNFAPQLVWIGFTHPDRLLTVRDDGRFDLWSMKIVEYEMRDELDPSKSHRTLVASFEPVAGGGDELKRDRPRIAKSDSSPFDPLNFALSPDGTRLAIFNGTGFSFYDMTDAKLLGRSNDILPGNATGTFSGAAWSPDGTRFACCYSISGKIGDHLHLWNASGGPPVGGGKLENTRLYKFGFWGSKHIVNLDTNSTRVYELDSLREVARLRTKAGGLLGLSPPTSELWAVIGVDIDFTGRTPKWWLVRAAVPDPLPFKSEWELGEDGLVRLKAGSLY